ncbi:efflux RND transporter periplasmic adaptor subunit [Zoogloea sp. LCSB751]|uniref:efflux RND transporter periplasmic adaptor subunit n=1 Tax=Zoogloea sp. LCSB751 TaxID=1965277 RepID=UPI000B496925|nr:efflux RND transporter periplasmic adaptor subunit [Zoogloea sp. LCSB751]
MKPLYLKLLRIAVTLVAIVLALFASQRLWDHYQVEPWTRDGRVRADIVPVTPDVSGLVTHVAIHDNQFVKQGQELFQIDTERYRLALKQADAAVATVRANLDQARREARRNAQLSTLVAQETVEQSREKVELGEAQLAQAIANRELAALNLARTKIVAPVDGYLSDLSLRSGNYVTAGKQVLAVLDTHSFHVDGYFEETKLQGVKIGQPAKIRIMGREQELRGHVESISAGIEDRDRANGNNLLPNVNPVFTWVRLAQRIPVRIALDEVPKDLQLVAGLTATVAIVDKDGHAKAAANPVGPLATAGGARQ